MSTPIKSAARRALVLGTMAAMAITTLAPTPVSAASRPTPATASPHDGSGAITDFSARRRHYRGGGGGAAAAAAFAGIVGTMGAIAASQARRDRYYDDGYYYGRPHYYGNGGGYPYGGYYGGYGY